MPILKRIPLSQLIKATGLSKDRFSGSGTAMLGRI
jgi:hypothetical protein